MDVATLIDRLTQRCEIWDDLASLQGPHGYGDVYHLCAAEIRAELRECDTIPPPLGTHSTTPCPPPGDE